MPMIGANQDWELTKNWSGTPMCLKKLGKVNMIIFEGLNGEPCKLSVHFNPYFPNKEIKLHFHDFESACNEADDVYRALLTEAIEYLTGQIRLLPEL